MKKFLKSDKGFAGVDISIAVIVVLIFVPTIFGISYTTQRMEANVRRKSEATSIITNILEIVKSEKYEDVKTDSSKLLTDIGEKYSTSTYKNKEKEEDGFSYVYFLKTGANDEHYQIQLGIKNYYPTEDNTEDLIKQVKVRVFYPYDNKMKDIDISIVIQNT